jgi:hypothetical protein
VHGAAYAHPPRLNQLEVMARRTTHRMKLLYEAKRLAAFLKDAVDDFPSDPARNI